MNFWIDVKIIFNGMISKVERIIKTLNLLKKWKQIDIDEFLPQVQTQYIEYFRQWCFFFSMISKWDRISLITLCTILTKTITFYYIFIVSSILYEYESAWSHVDFSCLKLWAALLNNAENCLAKLSYAKQSSKNRRIHKKRLKPRR